MKTRILIHFIDFTCRLRDHSCWPLPVTRYLTVTNTIKAQKGKHLMVLGDSASATFEPSFDLILTSPPYFHPAKRNPSQGFSPKTKELEAYSQYVVSVLLNCLQGLKTGKFLCVVKTDAWYKGRLIPIGYSIVNSFLRQGVNLHAHWIWERIPYYSPYSPSFANVFIFGEPPIRRIPYCGLVKSSHIKRQKDCPATFTPQIFETLIQFLCRPGDAVLDPFLGTGAVIEAAARTDRWAVGVEISRRQIANAKRLLKDRPIVVC
jgi:DNA modification methylase